MITAIESPFAALARRLALPQIRPATGRGFQAYLRWLKKRHPQGYQGDCQTLFLAGFQLGFDAARRSPIKRRK